MSEEEKIVLLRKAVEDCLTLLRGALGIIREDSPTVERAYSALKVTAPGSEEKP